MAADKKTDLRIQRTKDSIRKTFEEMICEMDYEQISIKELAQNFIKRTQGLERPRDMDKITREFFLYSEELGKRSSIICCPPLYPEHYHDICSTKHFGNLQTMGGRWEKNPP